MQNPDQPNITGTAINYLYICQRKLWFYQHHLEMEHTSEKVDLGKHLHEKSYPREKRRGMGHWQPHPHWLRRQTGHPTRHQIRSINGNSAHHANLLLPLSTQTERCVRQERHHQLPAPTPNNRNRTHTRKRKGGRRKPSRKWTKSPHYQTPPHAEYMKICKSCSYQELCWSLKVVGTLRGMPKGIHTVDLVCRYNRRILNMSRNYYITQPGRIRRKDNTIYLEPEDAQRIPIPVEDIDALYFYGELDLNTKLLNFLAQKKIAFHVFNYYGYYSGSYYPREYLNSGSLLVKQVQHYEKPAKRMMIAHEFVCICSF